VCGCTLSSRTRGSLYRLDARRRGNVVAPLGPSNVIHSLVTFVHTLGHGRLDVKKRFTEEQIIGFLRELLALSIDERELHNH
jgi:hypothetical protein